MSLSPLFVLFVVFLVLKLCDVVGWSWWCVTAPLWLPPMLSILLGVLSLVFVFTLKAFNICFKRKGKK